MITVSNISGDNRILIGNDYCGRAVDVLLDHSWTRARIAIRLCMDDSGADVNPANFFVGLSTGPSLLQFPAVPPDPAHAAMIWHPGSAFVWTRQTALLVTYRKIYNQGKVYINGVNTSLSTTIGYPPAHYVGAADDHRTLLFCDFIKGSPDWTVDHFGNDDPNCIDRSQVEFETQSAMLSPSILNYSWNGAMTMPVDEAANGYFTHVNIIWNNATPVIKISDLRVIVF